MPTIYKVDHNRVFTGETVELGPKDPIFPNSILTAPPETDGFAIWDGNKWFTRTEYPTPPQRVPPKPNRHISKGQFFDLFGDQKYPILSSELAPVRALIEDVKVREYIDLDDPQLPGGLQMLVDAGFTIDVDKVLAGPQEDDRA